MPPMGTPNGVVFVLHIKIRSNLGKKESVYLKNQNNEGGKLIKTFTTTSQRTAK